MSKKHRHCTSLSFFRKTFLSTPGHFKDSFFPSISSNSNTLHTFIQLSWLLVKSDYQIPVATILGQKRKISTAKTLTLNYFPTKVFRVTHHGKFKFHNIRPPAKV